MDTTRIILALSIAGWLAIVVSVVWAIWLAVAVPASLSTKCPICRYPMDPRVGMRCPECGSDASVPLDLYLRRRTWKAYALALGLTLGGVLCLTVVRAIAQNGVWATIPNAMLLRWGPTHMGAQGEKEIARRARERSLGVRDYAVLRDTCRSMLASPDQAVRLKGVHLAIAAESSDDPLAWDVLRIAFHHPDTKVRQESMQAVHFSEFNCPAWMIDELCGILAADGDSKDRAKALNLIAGVPVGNEDRIAKAMLAAMRSPDRPVALLAATKWNELRISSPMMDRNLDEMTKDSDLWLRRLADYALGNDALRAELIRESRIPVASTP